jgi:hypothetical protein
VKKHWIVIHYHPYVQQVKVSHLLQHGLTVRLEQGCLVRILALTHPSA